MLDYALPIFVVACLLIGVLGLLLTRNSARRSASRAREAPARKGLDEKPSEEKIAVLSDWQPSGRIDFGCPAEIEDENQPAPYLLRVEEYRTLQSPSGTKRMELRWRDATLKEAKRIVVRHNGEREVRRHVALVQSPSIAPDEAGERHAEWPDGLPSISAPATEHDALPDHKAQNASLRAEAKRSRRRRARAENGGAQAAANGGHPLG
jgi:hypothetical protein